MQLLFSSLSPLPTHLIASVLQDDISTFQPNLYILNAITIIGSPLNYSRKWLQWTGKERTSYVKFTILKKIYIMITQVFPDSPSCNIFWHKVSRRQCFNIFFRDLDCQVAFCWFVLRFTKFLLPRGIADNLLKKKKTQLPRKVEKSFNLLGYQWCVFLRRMVTHFGPHFRLGFSHWTTNHSNLFFFPKTHVCIYPILLRLQQKYWWDTWNHKINNVELFSWK